MQKAFFKIFFVVLGVLLTSTLVMAGNIDLTDKTARGYNNDIGRINFNPASTVGSSTASVTVTDTKITGYAWGENIGWINLSPTATTSWGISNNNGILSGYAWNETIGRINFKPLNSTPTSSVTIDTNGYFRGYAWSDVKGWISFNCEDVERDVIGSTACTDFSNYKVRTAWRPLTVNCSPNPTSAKTSVPITWTAYPSGGSNPYTYSWSGTDALGGTNSTSTISYSTTGTKNASVIVTSGVLSVVANCSSVSITSGGGGGTDTGGGTSVDVCPNIGGNQAILPSGMMINPLGECINIVDLCPNIADTQVTMPTDMILDPLGDCVAKPVDICANIAGNQSSVPTGMSVDDLGNCYTIPADVCPNMIGVQSSIPVGMTTDDSGNCVMIQSDLCPNIAGTQVSVPSTMTIDTAGNCVPISLDVCPNIAGSQSSVPMGMIVSDGDCIVPDEEADVCPNIGGTQSSVPTGYTVDGAGNCVVVVVTVDITGGSSTTPVATTTESIGITIGDIEIPIIPGIIVAGLKDSYEATKEVTVKSYKKTKEVMSTPEVAVTTKVLTTTGVAVSGAVGVATLFFNPASLLELFLLPLRLWGLLLSFLGLRRRNRPWGTVYDSITKQPLDPAYVSLQDLTGKEIFTSITDLDGRYGFFVNSGQYKIVANKTNYSFPSKRLSGHLSDELYDNLYFGEMIDVKTDGEVIAKNIALDPEKFDWNEVAKKNMGIMRFYSKYDLIFKKVSNIFFVVGLVLAIVAAIVAPYTYNIVIISLYGVMILLRMFGIRPKYYGWVLDKMTGYPMAYSLIHIYSVDLERELFKRTCDSTGRYYTLVPPGKYYISIDRLNPDQTYSKVYTSEPFDAPKGVINRVLKV